MESIEEFITFNLTGRIRRERLEGREHLVVPTVMIVEGVLHGTNGPLYYPSEELRHSVGVWDHKPIVVGHPGDGTTACQPSVLNSRKVGVLLNTRWDAPKLRTEAWIDSDRARQIDSRLVTRLEARQKVEVSTGLWLDRDNEPGTFNGRRYDAVARQYRPDHLAVLLDAVGACSVEDGAGMLQLNRRITKEEWDDYLLGIYGLKQSPLLPLPPREEPLPNPYGTKTSWAKQLIEIAIANTSQASPSTQEPIPEVAWDWSK